jgi:glycosyltransferase involved in cell wall biosynthesis
MLFVQDHFTHPIIRRQLVTLGSSGCELTVVDGSAGNNRVPGVAYHARHIRAVSLGVPARLVWIPLRRLATPCIGEAWWTLVHFLQVFMTAMRYAAAAARVDADYYQAHDLYSVLAALVAGRMRHRQVVYDAHELVSEQGNPRSLRNAVERRMERWLVPQTDALLVPSASRAAWFQQRCQLRTAPTVILNCPPTTERRTSNVLRARLGLADGTRVVLYHGTFMAGRALQELIFAAHHFEPGTVLVLIGEQNEYYRQVLRPLCEAQAARGRVFSIPFVDPTQVMDYVSGAELGVVLYENVNLNNYFCAPTKLYEYLMVRTPVVVSAFPDMLALLDEFAVGCACDPEDPKSIADAINSWLRSTSTPQPAVTEALERARRTFNWELESKKLLSVFSRHRSTAVRAGAR